MCATCDLLRAGEPLRCAMNPAGWTAGDAAYAAEDGWRLRFIPDRSPAIEELRSAEYGRDAAGLPRTYGHRPIELHAIDSIAISEDDDADKAPLLHVLRRARGGCVLASRALMILGVYSPREREFLEEMISPMLDPNHTGPRDSFDV